MSKMRMSDRRTVVFWGAGATAQMGMATTSKQNAIFLALSRKETCQSYKECLADFKQGVFGDRFDAVCDMLSLLDDDSPCVEGCRLCGFSQRQLDIVRDHADELGHTDDERKNRVVMMRQQYDWSSAMRILRLQKDDVEYENGRETPSETFTQKIYNLLDVNIASHSGLHVFPSECQSHTLSSFLDERRLRSAKSALIMFINLVFACAWATSRLKFADASDPYRRFADWLSEIRADEMLNGVGNAVFSTSFVSMNFDPILWWLIKNADARYNRHPKHVGDWNCPLFLGEDVDQADAVRPLRDMEPSVSSGLLPDVTARFVDLRGEMEDERCNARYQTVKIFFPHGSPNLKICPCCGKTTLYQGNVLEDSSESLFPPFFFKKLAWGCAPAEAIRKSDAEDGKWRRQCAIISYNEKHDVRNDNAESRKWQQGELDYIQCRHCGRGIRMCDAEMVMQSGLKSAPSHILQRISHNVDNAVMDADHIVLMGYSLPSDDGSWVAELQSRSTRNGGSGIRCSIVGHADGAPNEWLFGDRLDEYCEEHSVINRVRAVFGRENVRANLKGIPDVFESREAVRQMLYPDDWK